MSFINVNIKANDIFNFISQSDLERKITETALYNDSCNRNPFSNDLIRCYALSPQENCFGIRVNTMLSYCAVNQKVFLHSYSKSNLQHLEINIEFYWFSNLDFRTLGQIVSVKCTATGFTTEQCKINSNDRLCRFR